MTPAECRRRAMDFLARREHSRWELRHKVTAAGATGNLADEVLDALEAEGLLDDARFVESFVAARAVKGQGPVRISQELDRRGVAEPLIEDGIDEADVDCGGSCSPPPAGSSPPAGSMRRQPPSPRSGPLGWPTTIG